MRLTQIKDRTIPSVRRIVYVTMGPADLADQPRTNPHRTAAHHRDVSGSSSHHPSGEMAPINRPASQPLLEDGRGEGWSSPGGARHARHARAPSALRLLPRMMTGEVGGLILEVPVRRRRRRVDRRLLSDGCDTETPALEDDDPTATGDCAPTRQVPAPLSSLRHTPGVDAAVSPQHH